MGRLSLGTTSALLYPLFVHIVKQFVQEAERNIEEGQNAVAQVRVYQKKLAKYKSDIIELQRQQEENKERLRQKDKQLAEKENQIQQLKSILARNNSNNNSSNNSIRNSSGGRSIPSSSNGRVTATPRSSSSISSSSFLSVNHHHPSHHHHRGFQTYVRKKEERELAEERDLMNLTRNKNIIFGHRQR